MFFYEVPFLIARLRQPDRKAPRRRHSAGSLQRYSHSDRQFETSNKANFGNISVPFTTRVVRDRTTSSTTLTFAKGSEATQHQSLPILLCICWCFSRCAFCLNALAQVSHLNGFSPVCVLRCTLMFDLFRNPLLQMLHLCTGFSLPRRPRFCSVWNTVELACCCFFCDLLLDFFGAFGVVVVVWG